MALDLSSISDKKMTIIKTALRLFVEKGIHAVGINEVISASSVAKQTLYHHFPSKNALIICTLEYRDLLFMQWMKQCMKQDRRQGIDECIADNTVLFQKSDQGPKSAATESDTLQNVDASLALTHKRYQQDTKAEFNIEQAKKAIISLFYGLDDWFNNRVTPLGKFHGCFFINASAEYKDPNSEINQCCQQHKEHVRHLVAHYVDIIETDSIKANQLIDAICILKEGAITTALVQQDKEAAIKILPIIERLLKQ